MSFSVCYNGQFDEQPLKTIYSGTLQQLMKENSNIAIGEADICNGLWAPNYKILNETYPDRFIDVDIQEGNLVGVAAVMCVTGIIPY